jgi:hypothetical protein
MYHDARQAGRPDKVGRQSQAGGRGRQGARQAKRLTGRQPGPDLYSPFGAPRKAGRPKKLSPKTWSTVLTMEHRCPAYGLVVVCIVSVNLDVVDVVVVALHLKCNAVSVGRPSRHTVGSIRCSLTGVLVARALLNSCMNLRIRTAMSAARATEPATMPPTTSEERGSQQSSGHVMRVAALRCRWSLSRSLSRSLSLTIRCPFLVLYEKCNTDAIATSRDRDHSLRLCWRSYRRWRSSRVRCCV